MPLRPSGESSRIDVSAGPLDIRYIHLYSGGVLLTAVGLKSFGSFELAIEQNKTKKGTRRMFVFLFLKFMACIRHGIFM
jgi:hypothetical protein